MDLTMRELDLPGSEKFSSVDLDELQLQAQGHASELPRRFSMMSLLAFSFAIMNSWTGVVPLMLTDLSLGGAPAAVWTPIVAFVACSIITLGLAELASAFPSTGGQYQYVIPCFPSCLLYQLTYQVLLSWSPIPNIELEQHL